MMHTMEQQGTKSFAYIFIHCNCCQLDHAHLLTAIHHLSHSSPVQCLVRRDCAVQLLHWKESISIAICLLELITVCRHTRYTLPDHVGSALYISDKACLMQRAFPLHARPCLHAVAQPDCHMCCLTSCNLSAQLCFQHLLSTFGCLQFDRNPANAELHWKTYQIIVTT